MRDTEIRVRKSIKLLNDLLIELEPISERKAYDNWATKAKPAIKHIFGEQSDYLKRFDSIIMSSPISIYERKLDGRMSGGSVAPRFFFESGIRQHVELMKEMISDLSLSIEDEMVEEITNVQRIINLCERFDIVSRQLTRRHQERETIRINDEYDVQDLMHALLLLDFKDVRAEEWTPSNGGASSRMDFLLKQERIVVEIKMTRPTLKDKEVGEQLIIDANRYQSHPDCSQLFCFVYDPEHYIVNPSAIENDLSKDYGSLNVKVLIRP